MNGQGWRPTPLIALTGLVHIGAAALLLARPELWPWALGVVAGNHVVLTATGLWPRSRGLGPNWTRLPGSTAPDNAVEPGKEVALTIDDGPDPEVTPRVLDLLDAHGARATFFCIGDRAARHPELCREIVARGHAVENHSQQHRHTFSLLGPRGFRRELQVAQDTLTRITGERPLFFRAPAGLRNPFLDPVLHDLGLRLASWTRRGFDTRNGDADAVLRRLTRDLRAGDILLLHDGHAARTQDGQPVILAVLPRLLDMLAEKNLHTVTLRSTLNRP